MVAGFGYRWLGSLVAVTRCHLSFIIVTVARDLDQLHALNQVRQIINLITLWCTSVTQCIKYIKIQTLVQGGYAK